LLAIRLEGTALFLLPRELLALLTVNRGSGAGEGSAKSLE
jgi:hypothetical protein